MSEIYSWCLSNNGLEELYVKTFTDGHTGVISIKNLPVNTILYQAKAVDPPLSTRMLQCIVGTITDDNAGSPDPMLYHVNHSNNPNAVLNNHGQLKNISFIYAEEEILIDHSDL